MGTLALWAFLFRFVVFGWGGTFLRVLGLFSLVSCPNTLSLSNLRYLGNIFASLLSRNVGDQLVC